jgi:acyl-homoserine-lactone acylase
MAVPMWHANYADDQGHLMFVFDGLVPRRNGHDYDYWNKIVPGDTSATMWTHYLSFDELPKSIDLPAGWIQNANEPPWDATLPRLDRTKYASYVAPSGEALPQMRVLRSLRMITEDPKISYDELIAKKHSTRMELADRVLPDLLKAANSSTEAALSALAAAAADCQRLYGSLDVRWGDVFRLASGNADLPGNGGAGASGVFRTISYTRKVGNKNYAAAGETIVCAIEFAELQQARCTLGYGNASQPGSPHLEDQLPLMVQKVLHPVWREKKDVEANLEKRERF